MPTRPGVSAQPGSPAPDPSPPGPPDRQEPTGRARTVVAAALRVSRSTPFRVAFLLLMVTAAVATVLADPAAVAAAARSIGPWAVAGAVAGVAVNLAASTLQFRALLDSMGSRLPVRDAARVLLVGQLAKYLPGGVWNVVSQAELAADRGVPRARTAGASALTLAMSVGVCGVLAVPAIVAVSVPGFPVAVALLVPVGLLLFHPRLLNPVLAGLGRVVKRPGVRPLPGRAVAEALGWALLSWVGLGGQILALLLGVGAPLDGRTVLVAVCGFALAWLVGFLVLFAPAGAGAREVALVAVLLTVVDRPEALVVVLASRLVITAVEVAAAGLALALGRRPKGSAIP